MGNNKKLILLIVTGIFILIGLGYFLYSDTDTHNESLPKGNVVSFNGSELKEEKDGVLIWSVKADKISVDQDTKAITLEGITGTFHRDGTDVTIVAPKGSVTADHSNITLNDGIVAETNKGATLRTDSIGYDSKQQRFTTHSKFIFTNDDTILEGDALEADMVLEKVTAKGHAKLIRK